MTNAEARFNNSLRPRKPEGSLGWTAQDGHLDSHTAPELCRSMKADSHDVDAVVCVCGWCVCVGDGGWRASLICWLLQRKSGNRTYRARKRLHIGTHSSGAVRESRWPSWAVRPNEPSGFRGRKAILNRASALVTACP